MKTDKSNLDEKELHSDVNKKQKNLNKLDSVNTTKSENQQSELPKQSHINKKENTSKRSLKVENMENQNGNENNTPIKQIKKLSGKKKTSKRK